MFSTLVGVGGALDGRRFELRGDVVRLGRHPENDLQIRAVGISRRHGELRRQVADGESCWRVTDLDSRSGIAVNGESVHSSPLRHGDLVAFGASAFLFLEDQEAPDGLESRGTAASADDEVGSQEDGLWNTTASLHLGSQAALDVFRLPIQELSRRAARAAQVQENLESILDWITQVELESGRRQVALGVLRLLGGMTPLQGAALVETMHDGTPRVVASWSRNGEEPELRISRTVMARVLADRDSLLCHDASADPRFAGSESLAGDRDSHVAADAILCTPLVRRGQTLGVLWGEAPAAAGLGERHLKLAAAVATLAATPLDEARQLERLRQAQERQDASRLEHDLVGQSRAMKRLLDVLRRVARADSTVLIRGESGTGKELVARALHDNSPRAEGPFVALNCATLSETLLESELFGHEKGAFTGAVSRHVGRMEQADGGTLFLDEVAEIPVTLQAKLLRALQERSFERVGGKQTVTVDVRFVAASHRDLRRLIDAGSFRDDLYYRLAVVPLDVPPLRQRPGDIPLLAAHFARLHSRRLGRPALEIPARVESALAAHDWPGNVRELSNAIERAVVLAESGVLEPEDLPDDVAERCRPVPATAAGADSPGDPDAGGTADAPTFHDAVISAKRRILLRTLAECDQSVPRAAERLGLRRTYLHRLITRLDLRDHLSD